MPKTKKTTIKKRRKKTPEPKKSPAPRKERYFEAVGRRKTAVARVRLISNKEKSAVHTQEFLVNGKPLDKYFPASELQQKALAPLKKTDCLNKFKVSVKVKGGGLVAQAEAVRHGAARVLVLFNPDFRNTLKKVGFLTRDSRMRERKKFGLKRARRAPQWKKR